MTTQQVSARLQALQQVQFTAAFFQSYVILASSQAQETSKELPERGGLFTYYLLQGIGDETTASCPACERGQNEVSPAALLAYAADGVQTQVDQRPQLKGNTGQAEQLALLIPWIRPVPGATVRPRPVPTRAVTP